MTTLLKRKHVLAATRSVSVPFNGLVSTANLISYWKLNETTGNRLDSFGTNHLTPINNPTSGVGKIGNACDFESTNTQVLTHADASPLGNETFTYVFWFKRESSATDVVLLSGQSNGAFASYFFVIAADGRAFLMFGDGSQNAFTPDTPFNDTTNWHFFVGWHDAAADTLNLQVDNGAVNTQSSGGVFPTNIGPFRIGSGFYSGVQRYFDGLIDEVGLWRRVLTPAERTALYNSGNGLTF